MYFLKTIFCEHILDLKILQLNETVIFVRASYRTQFLGYTVSERSDKRDKRQTIINSKLGNIFTNRTIFD